MAITINLDITTNNVTTSYDITRLIVDFTESTVKQTKYDVYLNNGNRAEGILTWKTNFTLLVSGDHSNLNVHSIRTAMTEADEIGFYVCDDTLSDFTYYFVSVDLSDIKLENICNTMRYGDDTWTFKELKHETRAVNEESDD